jgi:hypothetical protein
VTTIIHQTTEYRKLSKRDHATDTVKTGNTRNIILIEAIRAKQINEMSNIIGVVDFRSERKTAKNRKGKR